MAIQLLLKNWKLVIIGLLLIALSATGIYINILKNNIVAIEAEKESLIIKLEVSNASIATLRNSIDEQNAAVQKLKEDADAREKASRNEILKAKIESANQKKRADDLMTRVRPQDKTSCEAANELFNEEILRRAK